MKPIRLAITAFGAYATTQVVDFTQLGERSFFLIHGATGAGKSTLLDAICFALYGETSGNERAADQMRSHHTPTGPLTEVTFDFALGAERYRITRQPKQMRPRARGTGLVEEDQKATLWRRTGCSADGDEGTLLAARWLVANQQIKALFGFDSKQFRQVIMLPQDQFRQLLKASSIEREVLFQALFQTETYSQIEAALKESAKALAATIRDQRNRADMLLQHAGAADAGALDSQVTALTAQKQVLEARLVVLQADEQMAVARRQQAEAVELRFVALERANEALEALLLRQTQAEIDRQTLAAARRALMLVDAEQTLRRQQGALREAQKEYNAAQAAQQAAELAQAQAVVSWEREQKRQPELEIERQHREELRELYRRVTDLQTARLALIQADQEVQAAQSEVDRVEHDWQTDLEMLARLEQAITVADGVEGRVAALRTAEKELKQESDTRRDLDKWLREHGQAEIHAAALVAAAQTAVDSLRAARHVDSHLQLAWRAGQVAALAQGLQPGQPCPVCGATDHPQPAQPGAQLSLERDLEASQQRLQQAEVVDREAQAAVHRQQALLSDLNARIETLATQLADRGHLTSNQLAQELAQTVNQRQQAEAQEQQLNQAKRERQKLRQDQPALEADRKVKSDRLERARADLLTRRTQVKERGESVPADLQTLEAVAAAGKAAGAHVLALETAFAEAQTNAYTAQATVARTLAVLGQREEQAARLQAETDVQATQFEQHLHESGFEREADYQRARQEPAEMARLEAAITEFDASLHIARDRQTQAEKGIAELARPDLTVLRGGEADAKQLVTEAAKQLGGLTGELAQAQRLADQLRTIAVDLVAHERRYAVLGRVADVANGTNLYKLNFQRFVLGALLDDVLVQASRRLQVMSNGRYLLQRRREPLNQRRAAGLDLDVTDTWTGESTRPIETLSGGEGFMASLALALGLADTVQTYTGGIRLDTIFVDEGFGSLDADALDRAIQTLLSLKAGGRLVGIISHVDSLKERISTRLEVIAGQQGSTARFVIN